MAHVNQKHADLKFPTRIICSYRFVSITGAIPVPRALSPRHHLRGVQYVVRAWHWINAWCRGSTFYWVLNTCVVCWAFWGEALWIFQLQRITIPEELFWSEASFFKPHQDAQEYTCHLVTPKLEHSTVITRNSSAYQTQTKVLTCSSSVGGRLEQDELQCYWGYRGAFRSGKRQDMQRTEWRKSEPYKERHALYRRWIIIRSSAGWTQHFCILLNYQKAPKYITESVSK